MARGIVYVMTNPQVHDADGRPWVKIGITGDSLQDLKNRMNSLSVGTPGRYRPRHAVSVKNARKAESLLKKVFEHCQSDGEFYLIPVEQVKAAVDLTLVHGQSSGEVANQISRFLAPRGDSRRKKRQAAKPPGRAQKGVRQKGVRNPSFKFSSVGIRVGAKLLFYKSDSIKAEVAEDNKVRLDGKGEPISLSKAASMAFEKIGRTRKHPQACLLEV